jgi:hypothetical protein
VALEKVFDSEYLTAALPEAYHRITGLSLDFARQSAQVTVSVYESKAARDAGKAPLSTRAINITPVDYPQFQVVVGSAMTTAQDPVGTLAYDIARRSLYALLKEREEYQGAKDA